MPKHEVKFHEIFDDHEVPLEPVVKHVLEEMKYEIADAFGFEAEDIGFEVSIGGWQKAHVAVYPVGKCGAFASFDLEQCPGCCAIGITSFMRLAEGLEKQLNFMTYVRERIAKEAKYGVLMATITEHQKFELKMLDARGWHPGSAFRNPKTKNTLQIWTKDLTHALDMG